MTQTIYTGDTTEQRPTTRSTTTLHLLVLRMLRHYSSPGTLTLCLKHHHIQYNIINDHPNISTNNPTITHPLTPHHTHYTSEPQQKQTLPLPTPYRTQNRQTPSHTPHHHNDHIHPASTPDSQDTSQPSLLTPPHTNQPHSSVTTSAFTTDPQTIHLPAANGK